MHTYEQETRMERDKKVSHKQKTSGKCEWDTSMKMSHIWKQTKKHIQRNERMEKFRKMQIWRYSAVMLVLSLLLQYTYMAMSCTVKHNKKGDRTGRNSFIILVILAILNFSKTEKGNNISCTHAPTLPGRAQDPSHYTRFCFTWRSIYWKHFQFLAATATSEEGVKLHSQRDPYHPRDFPTFSNPYMTAAN